MSEPKHTPGPWTVRPWFRNKAWIVRADGDGVAELAVALVEGVATSPDARLIAAAPDLYDACKEVLDKLDYLTGLWGQEAITRRLQDRVREVVARVDGGTEEV
jgi:hypothetical protein